MEFFWISNFDCLASRIFILVFTGAIPWLTTSQTIFDPNNSNEVFDEAIYVDTYRRYTLPSSPVETNFTSFLLLNSRTNFSQKSTTQGLDITSPQMFQSKTIAQLYAVFPGTVWCGVGNLAGDNEVLGYFSKTDSCCRTHDKCHLTIPSGAEKFGLKNTGFFTRSHCSCDEALYNCLKEINSFVSNKVGFTYFNLLRPQCFRKDFPVLTCLRWFKRRCRTYLVDQDDYKEWQWFDNKEY